MTQTTTDQKVETTTPGTRVTDWLAAFERALAAENIEAAVDLFALALACFVVASILAYLFDGTVLIANRERIVLRRWFRKPRVLAIRDLSRIVLCSIDSEYLRGPNNWVPAIFFFNRDGRCVMSLYSRFRGEDLAQLWAMIGIKPEGSWSDRVRTSELNQHFPGAF